ncbi:MAG: hypothetical protein ACXVHB_23795 [Solirubrobacteraceae bacterium]
MRTANKLCAVAAAVLTAAGAATAIAASSGGTAKPNPLTGYPTKIKTIDLSGYQIETSYPLDKGETYLQTYSGNNVTAVAVKGPFAGSPAVHFKYIAMPVAHDMLLLVWLEPKFKHNTFVYNLRTHISSVVTWDQKGDPSLGSVFVVKTGKHPIP